MGETSHNRRKSAALGADPSGAGHTYNPAALKAEMKIKVGFPRIWAGIGSKPRFPEENVTRGEGNQEQNKKRP